MSAPRVATVAAARTERKDARARMCQKNTTNDWRSSWKTFTEGQRTLPHRHKPTHRFRVQISKKLKVPAFGEVNFAITTFGNTGRTKSRKYRIVRLKLQSQFYGGECVLDAVEIPKNTPRSPIAHVAFPKGTLGWLQQKVASPLWWLVCCGCHLNRRGDEIIRRAGFAEVHLEERWLDVPLIVARHVYGYAVA